MSRQTTPQVNRVVSLKTRAPLACFGNAPSLDDHPARVATRNNGEAALAVPCVRDGNFCLCWMPAWFYLAERVGEERKTDAHPQ